MARQSSASAARSVFGGYVALDARAHEARLVAPASHFPLELVVAVTREGEKETGSTDGMEHTKNTSPYYAAWLASAPPLCLEVEQAITSKDLERLGPLVEHSALLMHASMLGANPAIVYFSPASISAIETVRTLRKAGTLAYFTMDAGPHVKVICAPEDTPRVATALEAAPGVLRTIRCKLGPDATVSTATTTTEANQR
jgi:diphosphomevalonate decarboxylase